MQIPVWDPLLRLFHWSLAAFFLLAYFTEGEQRLVHSQAGYTVALLVGFRLIWGFIGPLHARFASFLPRPAVLFNYLMRLLQRTPPAYAGHDPAGAAMIVALLLSLTVTAFTGMALFGMEGSGPLAGSPVSQWHGGTLERVHGYAADTTLVLVVMHIAGVIYTSVMQKQNLISAMVTGRKQS